MTTSMHNQIIFLPNYFYSKKSFKLAICMMLLPCIAHTQPLEPENIHMEKKYQTEVVTEVDIVKSTPLLETELMKISKAQDTTNSARNTPGTTQRKQTKTESSPPASHSSTSIATVAVATSVKHNSLTDVLSVDAKLSKTSDIARNTDITSKDLTKNSETLLATDIPRHKSNTSSFYAEEVIRSIQQGQKNISAEHPSQTMLSASIAAGGVFLAIGGSLLVSNLRQRKEKTKGNHQDTELTTAPKDKLPTDSIAYAPLPLHPITVTELAAVVESCIEPTPLHKIYTTDSKHIDASKQAYIEPTAWMTALMRTYSDRVHQIPGSVHALTCIAGGREYNQDYVSSFELKTAKCQDLLQVMIVADGCGGHYGGSEAACIAVRFSSESVIANVDLLTPEALLMKAFSDASMAMHTIGSRHWTSDDLRTTLIMVIATPTTYYVGWIGDGGVSLHRQTGHWEELMVPHKGEYQNILEASLGPTQDGTPSFKQAERLAGDHLYMGSDGIFDVVDNSFWDWFESNSQSAGWPQLSMDQLINLAGKDPHFDDNMSVAFLKTSTERGHTKTLPMQQQVPKDSQQIDYSPVAIV